MKHRTTGSTKRRRRDDGAAFLPDPTESGQHVSDDDLADNLAERYLESATSGEEQTARSLDEAVAEDVGGPFVEEGEPPADDVEDLTLDRRKRRPNVGQQHEGRRSTDRSPR
jgi:hypothetical protein